MDPPALPGTCCPGGPAALWVGGAGAAAYLGPSLRLAPHSGSVACFVLGVDAPFRLRADGCDRAVRSALVPARTVHHLTAGPGRMLFGYLEPGSARARHLHRGMTDRAGPILLTHGGEADLLDAARRSGPADVAALLTAIAPDGGADDVDPRVRRTLDMVRDQPHRVTAATLAGEVGLSASRLLHLFSAEVGTSFRRYRLWARIVLVAGALSRGADLTTAAARAGFATPSHLSDTVRGMFGLSATRLLAGPVHLVVDAPERWAGPAGRPGSAGAGPVPPRLNSRPPSTGTARARARPGAGGRR